MASSMLKRASVPLMMTIIHIHIATHIHTLTATHIHTPTVIHTATHIHAQTQTQKRQHASIQAKAVRKTTVSSLILK
jgi:hypothetical protein